MGFVLIGVEFIIRVNVASMGDCSVLDVITMYVRDGWCLLSRVYCYLMYSLLMFLLFFWFLCVSDFSVFLISLCFVVDFSFLLVLALLLAVIEFSLLCCSRLSLLCSSLCSLVSIVCVCWSFYWLCVSFGVCCCDGFFCVVVQGWVCCIHAVFFCVGFLCFVLFKEFVHSVLWSCLMLCVGFFCCRFAVYCVASLSLSVLLICFLLLWILLCIVSLCCVLLWVSLCLMSELLAILGFCGGLCCGVFGAVWCRGEFWFSPLLLFISWWSSSRRRVDLGFWVCRVWYFGDKVQPLALCFGVCGSLWWVWSACCLGFGRSQSLLWCLAVVGVWVWRGSDLNRGWKL